MARTGSIYALCDKAGEPYYVGKTVQSPGVRLGEHRRESTTRGRRSAVHVKTTELICGNDGPAIWVLEAGIKLSALDRREQYWIAYCEHAGFVLLNYTGGGNGGKPLRRCERERQARIASRQPRDSLQRFLPYGAPETVQDDGQVSYSLTAGLPF